MPLILTRRRALQATLGLSGALVLPAARACQFDTTTLRITHPWTRESRPDDRVALMCMKFDQVLEDDRLIGVQSMVASGAEMGGERAGAPVDFRIPAGVETEMFEHGEHIRLLGLKMRLGNGLEFPLTLTFEKGGTVNAKLTVNYARFT
jgi:copper(I)-binding protein